MRGEITMPVYLSSFSLPIDQEEGLIRARAAENGGCFPYIDNIYPCNIFDEKDLRNIAFGKVTIFYGGNGSGKSTLLNLIAQKLGLKRIAPYNSGELPLPCASRYNCFRHPDVFIQRSSGPGRIHVRPVRDIR